jgi:hypothetical protein
MRSRTLQLCAVIFVFVAAVVGDVNARPACSTRSIVCGTVCTYNSANNGGSCSGTSSNTSAYCYKEMVTNDYGTVVYSCFDGTYEPCCDDNSPY